MRFVRLSRAAAVAIAAIGLSGSVATAQVMRFETSAGSFDMTLNPTNDANLQPLVDNIVAYIGLGRYHYTAINRAADGGPGTADDFVLQMGGFLGFQPLPDLFAANQRSVEALSPVIVDSNNDGQVDFAAGSNQRGEVSLALSAAGPNSGTSSFFINLGDNSFLDSQGFVPFARIEDMTTVDRIMRLMQVDQSGGNSNRLDLTDIPVLESGRMVLVHSVRVVQAAPDFSFTGPIASALDLQRQNAAATAAAAAALASADQQAVGATPGIGAATVPEPTTALLALLSAAALLRRRG